MHGTPSITRRPADARSRQTLLIAREGVLAPEFSSIEAWLGRPGNTWEYYRELGLRGPVFRPDQDVSRWIRFNLVAYHQQAQTVQGRWDRSGAVWDALGGLELARTPMTPRDPYAG